MFKLYTDNVKFVALSNHRGDNDDARGIRYLDWKLYYWKEFDVYNESGITLHDLIIAAYKIKSHKFDAWFELFCNINSLRIDDDSLHIGTKFDHGS
jgi:hypothetical protein